jgi:hypothetical protein
MNQMGHSWLFAGVLVLTFWGCGPMYKDSVIQRSQTIRVTSEPPGATVSVVDDNGSTLAGETPTAFHRGYSTLIRSYDRAACAGAGFAAAADALPTVDRDDSQAEAGLKGIFGLVMLLAGTAVGAASCPEGDVTLEVYQKTVQVLVALPGYLPQQVAFQIPKEKPTLHFQLLPDPDAAAPRPVVAGGGDQPSAVGRIGVFDIEDRTGRFDDTLRRGLTEHLVQALGVLDQQLVGSEEVNAWRVDAFSGQVNPCRERSCWEEVGRGLDFQLALRTHIEEVDGRCRLRGDLEDLWAGETLRSVFVNSPCTLEDLFFGVEELAGQLPAPSVLMAPAS